MLCIEYEFCRLVTLWVGLYLLLELCIEYEFCRLVTALKSSKLTVVYWIEFCTLVTVNNWSYCLCIEYEFCRLVTRSHQRLSRMVVFNTQLLTLVKVTLIRHQSTKFVFNTQLERIKPLYNASSPIYKIRIQYTTKV